MDDARRFLRYLIPGSLFFVQAGLVLFGIFPDWAIGLLKDATTKDGVGAGTVLGLAFGFLVTSGTLGFVLSMIHHALYWSFPFAYRAVDYRRFLRRSRRGGLISERLLQPSAHRTSIIAAWIIFTKLWHERIETSPKIKSANPRANSMADLVHSTGACRVALVLATLAAIVAAIDRALSLGPEGLSRHWLLATFVLLTAASLLLFSHISYLQTNSLATSFAKRVLRSALEDPPTPANPASTPTPSTSPSAPQISQIPPMPPAVS